MKLEGDDHARYYDVLFRIHTAEQALVELHRVKEQLQEELAVKYNLTDTDTVDVITGEITYG